MKIGVSSCLLGINCKYNGKSNINEDIIKLKGQFELVPICPEVLGGLGTPRTPAEIINDKVINKDGIDVTKNYNKGAEIALELAKIHNPEFIVLKEKSPSCGVNYIYDGSFTSTLIKGHGITSRLLKKHGYKLYSEIDLNEEKEK